MNNSSNQALAATREIKDEGTTVDRLLCLFGSNASNFMPHVFVKLKSACWNKDGIPRFSPTYDE